jgi:hypothetical protein
MIMSRGDEVGGAREEEYIKGYGGKARKKET